MNAREYYQAGQLKEAIAAMLAEAKQHPTDTARRWFLCELLCFSGELDRLDKQLDTIGSQDAEAMVGVSLFRQLLRAEEARQQFYTDGRLPEFLDLPSPTLKLYLEASIRLREGKGKEAAELLAQAEQQRVKPSGTCNGQPFTDLRDLDDLTAPIFEVLTSTGKYYWIPVERVESVEFHAPERPRDLCWRRAHMIVRGGPDGEVYLPAVYSGTQTEANDVLRLGRATEWRGSAGEPIRGIGQRTFLVGEESFPIMELKEITIAEHPPA
jgi:type VI secretion system protein ImpE